MEKVLVIGSDVRYTFTEDDRIHVPDPGNGCPAESMLYRAQLMELGRFGEKNMVAVKKFCIDSSSTEAAQVTNSDLLTRWENVTKLKHGNVISYHKIAIQWMHPEPDSNRRFIELNFVMDYCDGSSLTTMLSDMRQGNRTLTMKTLFDFSKQMATGLAYLHGKNIVHGDLKESSVLVSRSSTNHLRLRLSGLHNFAPSYVHFVLRRFYGKRSVAPELLTIIREGASVVLGDPYFSAFHIIQKLLAKGNLHFHCASGILMFETLMRDLIHMYGHCYLVHRQSAGKLKAKELFSKYLQRVPTAVSGFDESDVRTKPFSKFINILQEICAMDFASAQEYCARLRTDHYSCATHKASVVPLDTVISTYFQHRRAPPTAGSFPGTGDSDSLQSCSLSEWHQSVRVDGRKADMWSLGSIMRALAVGTFDVSRKMDDWTPTATENFEKLYNIWLDTLGAEHMVYRSSFIPRDFSYLIDSCGWASKRLTAEGLINELVVLEEHTYGSTWVTTPQDEVTQEKESDSHRQMLKEIGCTCEYCHSFWSDFLGQGTYGYVYKARVTRFGNYKGKEIVAIKVITMKNIKIKQMQEDNSWEKAEKQWRKLLSLKHPHLVTYHKVSVWKLTTGAAIEFMMSYCEGGDLDALITQCRTRVCSLSTEAVINYATQLATGIHFLHENQFIHGDLKPGNVFMSRATGDTGNRTLRIGDLDAAVLSRHLDAAVLSRHDSSTPECKDLTGTVPYMSPEMVLQTLQQDHDSVEFPTDMWSYGCVILDLANCSAGIQDRLFHKTVANEEDIFTTHKIERRGFSAEAFLFRLSQGYHPFVSEIIHQETRDIIQYCLLPACQDRATAALVLEQLLCGISGDVDDIARQPELASTHSKRAQHYWLAF